MRRTPEPEARTEASNCAPAAPIVRAEAVSKRYRADDEPALRLVSLAVQPGEFVALLGPSGCGKTTLLNLLGAIDQPTSGQIWLAGQNTSALNDDHLTRLRRRKVGFIFQLFHLLPALTLLENVELPLLLEGGIAPSRAREQARLRLCQVGLEQRGCDFPHRLSGGEMQRVAIARALVHHPALVIADEPTGNLDSCARTQVLRLLNELCRESSTAVVMATHSQEAAAIAGRVLRLSDGRLE